MIDKEEGFSSPAKSMLSKKGTDSPSTHRYGKASEKDSSVNRQLVEQNRYEQRAQRLDTKQQLFSAECNELSLKIRLLNAFVDADD